MNTNPNPSANPTKEQAMAALTLKEVIGIDELQKRNRALTWLFVFLILFVFLLLLVYFFNKRPF
jgi:hypothetical protein